MSDWDGGTDGKLLRHASCLRSSSLASGQHTGQLTSERSLLKVEVEELRFE